MNAVLVACLTFGFDLGKRNFDFHNASNFSIISMVRKLFHTQSCFCFSIFLHRNLSIHNSVSLLMICGIPSVLVDFESLYIKADCLERSKFPKTCTVKSPWIFYYFQVPKRFKENNTFWGESSNYTSICTMRIARVPLLVRSMQIPPFSMLHWFSTFSDFR